MRSLGHCSFGRSDWVFLAEFLSAEARAMMADLIADDGRGFDGSCLSGHQKGPRDANQSGFLGSHVGYMNHTCVMVHVHTS